VPGERQRYEQGALSRREVLARAGVLAAAVTLAPLPDVASRLGLLGTSAAATDAVVLDTLSGLVAYVVPGNDRYSRAQGQSTLGPGGVAAGAPDELRLTLNIAGPGLADAAAAILNALAAAAHPGGQLRGFASHFAALRFAEKDAVIRGLAHNADPTMQELGATVPALAAFLSYSEAGALDPRTGRLRHEPVGWRITGYTGVADIRNEFRGYYGGHRSARPSAP
jgi:hypothetical protein